MRPTPTQRAILERMAAGETLSYGRIVERVSIGGRRWVRQATFDGLLRRDLIEPRVQEGTWGYWATYVLTDAGRAVLTPAPDDQPTTDLRHTCSRLIGP